MRAATDGGAAAQVPLRALRAAAFRLFYEHAGALYFEGERLPADSCEGAQQGDSLGPFIFALAFHATLQQVAAEYPDCVFVAFLDDVTVLCPLARAYAALQRQQSLAETQCDLKTDTSKSAACSRRRPPTPSASPEMDFIACINATSAQP